MIKWILEKFLGVELKLDNLNLKLGRILACTLVIIITYLILVPFDLFSIIENLAKSSGQIWYAEILAKYSFIAVSIRIIALTLFTKLENPIGRFRAAFAVQLIGFIGGIIMHSLLNNFINPSPNIDSTIKFTYSLLPFAVNAIIFVALKRIYEDEDFDEKEFFRTNS